MWAALKTGLFLSLIFILSLANAFGMNTEGLFSLPPSPAFSSMKSQGSPSRLTQVVLSLDLHDTLQHPLIFQSDTNNEDDEAEKALIKPLSWVSLPLQPHIHPQSLIHQRKAVSIIRDHNQSPFDARLFSLITKIHSSLSPPLLALTQDASLEC
jgi:hypothetical protein